MSCTLGEIASHIGAELRGDAECRIYGVAAIHDAKPGDITFLANRRYARFLKTTRASAVILSADDASVCPVHALITGNPYLGYARAARLLFPDPVPVAGIHADATVAPGAIVDATACIGPRAVVGDRAQIGARAWIGPGCVIAEDVTIGDDTYLVANVTVCARVVLGKRVLVYPGAVIGADGFGYAEAEGGVWVKIPQLGTVRIGDDVEIGANTTIDRGALGDTEIEEGVKIDNQVQIGHNVRIGAHTAIAGCVGIAGSAQIGKRCRIGGGCGIGGHLEIADDVYITGMSAVSNSIKTAGIYSSGITVTDTRTWRRNLARFHRLDETIRSIEARIGGKSTS